MSSSRTILALTGAAILAGLPCASAWAETAADPWFTGQAESAPVASDNFAVPETLTSGSVWTLGSDIDAGVAGTYWIGSTVTEGALDAPNYSVAGNRVPTPDLSVMATGYLAGEVFGVVPYVGAGFGATPAQANNPLGFSSSPDDQTWALAYQGVAGLSYNVTPWMSTGFEYRYFATEQDLALGGDERAQPFQSHDILWRLNLGF